MQWVGLTNIFLPEAIKREHNSLSIYFSLQYTTLYIIVQIYTQLCVNNVEVTVNTCTCTVVFTVITTIRWGNIRELTRDLML